MAMDFVDDTQSLVDLYVWLIDDSEKFMQN